MEVVLSSDTVILFLSPLVSVFKQQTSPSSRLSKRSLVSSDSAGTPSEEEEGESKEDQQKVSFRLSLNASSFPCWQACIYCSTSEVAVCCLQSDTCCLCRSHTFKCDNDIAVLDKMLALIGLFWPKRKRFVYLSFNK